MLGGPDSSHDLAASVRDDQRTRAVVSQRPRNRKLLDGPPRSDRRIECHANGLSVEQRPANRGGRIVHELQKIAHLRSAGFELCADRKSVV